MWLKFASKIRRISKIAVGFTWCKKWSNCWVNCSSCIQPDNRQEWHQVERTLCHDMSLFCNMWSSLSSFSALLLSSNIRRISNVAVCFTCCKKCSNRPYNPYSPSCIQPDETWWQAWMMPDRPPFINNVLSCFLENIIIGKSANCIPHKCLWIHVLLILQVLFVFVFKCHYLRKYRFQLRCRLWSQDTRIYL